MRLRDVATDELLRAFAATEKVAGLESLEARVLRRELDRRNRLRRRSKQKKGSWNARTE